ncbi:MAG: phenylalanine--tRNA ligase subunit alpha [Endomicrobium sp.]|jgi:phenylalanyl-tRNA synthetase alpha chain|nr:phenylalanine--tRNA ligase subunit alpha [Endomicrobium sp.]
MKNNLIFDNFYNKINDCDFTELKKIQKEYFGKNGIFIQILKSLHNYNDDYKKDIGSKINKAKNDILVKINKEQYNKNCTNVEKNKNNFDCSEGLFFPFVNGNFHPISKTIYDISSIFKSFGFLVSDGPELETDWYNFESLNIPKNHSVRDLHDTFYIDGYVDLLLRTHTSPGQIHIMEKHKPPIKAIIPGKVYRNESSDSSHSSMFHQIEGIEVDENITFLDLKNVLFEFVHAFFSRNLKLRFRPSYFQFTEPSTEVDIQCNFCNGNGCKICKNSGWIEILGCGMVHPNVLKSVNYDKEKYTGYAFGIGVERITMLKYDVSDVRLFYENDLRFLKQF